MAVKQNKRALEEGEAMSIKSSIVLSLRFHMTTATHWYYGVNFTRSVYQNFQFVELSNKTFSHYETSTIAALNLPSPEWKTFIHDLPTSCKVEHTKPNGSRKLHTKNRTHFQLPSYSHRKIHYPPTSFVGGMDGSIDMRHPPMGWDVSSWEKKNQSIRWNTHWLD